MLTIGADELMVLRLWSAEMGREIPYVDLP